MSLSTIFIIVIGIFSFFIFFYFLRFKASSKQTDRSDRLKWSSYFTYKDREKNLKGKNPDPEEDAQFKD